MTYKDVLLAAAGIALGTLCTPTQAQTWGSKLTATIGSDGKIISGSDWIAKVERVDELYIVTFKTKLTQTHHCEASIPGTAAPKGVKADDLGTMLDYRSDDSVKVETFYEDHESNDDVPAELQFDLECKL